MKKLSLYDYTLDELNTMDYMAIRQDKYGWYDAAMILRCKEFDRFLTLNASLGLLSESKLKDNNRDFVGEQNVTMLLRRLNNFVYGYVDNKKGMLNSESEHKYKELGKKILDIFDELEKYKEFDDLKKEYEEYMECVCEYFCLSSLEYLTKGIYKGSNLSASLYKLGEVVDSNIHKVKIAKEDIEKMNKLVSQTDFSDLDDRIVDKYLLYIKSFTDIVNRKLINKR